MNPELVAQVQKKRAIAANPGAEKRLEMLGRQAQLHDSLSKSLTKEINERVPTSTYDPIKAQAAKLLKLKNNAAA